jgi:hypothetical protein
MGSGEDKSFIQVSSDYCHLIIQQGICFQNAGIGQEKVTLTILSTK